MLPKLTQNQNAFIEITNTVHGGFGWELGTCLWSPVYSNSPGKKVKAWKVMEKVKPTDIILHLVDIDKQYRWLGVSRATSSLIQTNEEPTKAGKWSDNAPYQRINIEYFSTLPHPVPITAIFNEYRNELISILKTHGSQFYVQYGPGVGSEIRMAQKYFAVCHPEVYELFNEISNDQDFNPVFGTNKDVPTQHEPQNPDFNPPGRIPTMISRIIRDTILSRKIKKEHSWKCQICGIRVLLPNSNAYAEAHHLIPLGGESQGPDIEENIMILCPTHHTEFDYGSIAINPTTNLIEHVDSGNPFHLKVLAYVRTNIGKKYILYHYEKRFNKA